MDFNTIIAILGQVFSAIATGIYIFFSLMISFIVAVFQGLFM